MTLTFRTHILLRLLLVAAFMSITVYILWQTPFFLAAFWTGLFGVGLFLELIRFIERRHREMKYFLEAIEQNDFSPHFAQSVLPGEKQDLKAVYNRILNTFRKLRSDRESQHQLLHLVIEQISWGVIGYNEQEEIILANQAAKNIFHRQQWYKLSTLEYIDYQLLQLIREMKQGDRELYLYQASERKIHLAIQAIELAILSEPIKLITFQDISPELETQELESWQKLIRVLTHEISNSVIPISTLSSMSQELLESKHGGRIEKHALEEEDLDDLYGNLKTIAGRSQGLARFVKEYRSLTNLTPLSLSSFDVRELIDRVVILLKPKIEAQRVDCVIDIEDSELKIAADFEKIEQVLINLIKNALEALVDTEKPELHITASNDDKYQVYIKITDNGKGIPPEILDTIFTPFFTTKSAGTGIGLSLSRQILSLHKGTIQVYSQVGEGTSFVMQF